MRGKGPNGSNCWKITAVIHTSKDSDFPLAFLLRRAELSLDQGCTSPIHFPTQISAKLRSLSHFELCAPGRILTHRQHLLDTLDVEVALTSCKGHKRFVRFYKWMRIPSLIRSQSLFAAVLCTVPVEPYFEGTVKMCNCSDFWQQGELLIKEIFN